MGEGPGHGFPMTACGHPTRTGTPCQNEVTLFTPHCAAGHRPLRGGAYAPAMAPQDLRPAVFDAEELAGGAVALSVPLRCAPSSLKTDDVEDLISWFETPYVRPDATRTERSRLWAGCVAPVPKAG